MGYVFQNIHGVLTVRDESTLNEPKQIRFIDPHYNEKFQIADGGSVKIHYSDGVEKTYVCRYLDDYHFCLGYSTYHICEFAERMEKLGAHVETCSSKEIHKQKKERESDRDSR